MTDERLARERREHADRLQRALDEAGLSQTHVARHLGVTAQFVNDIMMGRKRVTRQFAHFFQSEFHVNSAWLLNGRGSMWHVPPPEATERERSTPVPLAVELPRSFDEIGRDPRQPRLKLVTDIARPATPGRRRFVYLARDDQMAPMIVTGDRVLFEARRKHKLEEIEGKVCALRIAEEELVRRIELEEHESRALIHLASPNPDVRRRRVTRREQDRLTIVGTLEGLVWRSADAMSRNVDSAGDRDGERDTRMP